MAAETPKGAWGMTTLLFFYMLVNFADKIVVGLAAVPIMKDMGLSPEQFGLLGSVFFSLYAVSAIVVGIIADRVATKWILLVLGVIWAVVQFPMLGTVGFTTLLVCRILLGVGEGPAAAVATHAIYKWFPDEKRTMPTAILSQGSAMGVIIAVPGLNWVIVNYSWHEAFGVLGVIGLIWCVVWFALGKEGPIKDEVVATTAAEAPRVPYMRLFLAPTFIGSVLASFGAYWALTLGLTWFTAFIVQGLGFQQKDAGWISILPWVFGAVDVLLTGWISQVMMARGISTRYARGVLGSLPLVIGGFVVLLIPHVGSAWVQIALLVIGTGLTGSIYVVCAPMISEYTPVSQRGTIIATFGAIYTLAGVLAPLVMGSMVQRAATPIEGYHAGFTINAVLLIIAGVAGMLLMWPNTEKARLARAADGAMVQKAA